jgi:hypothetical protein
VQYIFMSPLHHRYKKPPRHHAGVTGKHFRFNYEGYSKGSPGTDGLTEQPRLLFYRAVQFSCRQSRLRTLPA